MRATLVVGLAVVLCVRASSGRAEIPPTLSFETFDDYADASALEKQWRTPHGDPSRIRLEPSFTKQGGQALRFDYKITKYATRASFVDRDPRAFEAIRFWVKPDGSGRVLDLGIKNHAQKGFQTKDLLRLDGKDPVLVSVPFERFGPAARDELLEEIWFIVRGQPGEGSIAIDGFEFVQNKPVVKLDDFDGYKTPLAAFQHWKPTGPAAKLGDVEPRSVEADARSGASLALKYDLPRVDGAAAFVDADARGYEGVRLWLKNVGAAKTFVVGGRNHAQQRWETPPQSIKDAAGHAYELPFFAFAPADRSHAPGAPFVDAFLERLYVRLADGQGTGTLFIDDVQLYRHIAGAKVASVTALRTAIKNVDALTAPALAGVVKAIADQPESLKPAPLLRFATVLKEVLKGKPVDEPGLVLWLAGDVDQVVNPAGLDEGQVNGAVNDFGSGLRKAGVSESLLEKARAALRPLAPAGVPAAAAARKGPSSPYRFSLASAPTYDRSVVIEDFEGDRDIFKRWYQPVWSTGVTPVVQTELKSEGAQGLTVSHVGPLDKYNGFAKILGRPRDLRGMNALRMWIKPHAQTPEQAKAGRLSTGFIDGSDEIWQIDLPDAEPSRSSCKCGWPTSGRRCGATTGSSTSRRATSGSG
jgi:hypothetical protein